jgi:hypothetical protein
MGKLQVFQGSNNTNFSQMNANEIGTNSDPCSVYPIGSKIFCLQSKDVNNIGLATL